MAVDTVSYAVTLADFINIIINLKEHIKIKIKIHVTTPLITTNPKY